MNPQRVLIRGVNWLGDAVMTTPALGRLREKFPGARITILTPDKMRELWPGHPAVNETIPFSPDENVFAVAKKLRDEKFDLAVVFPNSPRSALELWLAKIPGRVGYARPWRNFFLTRTVAPRDDSVKMRKKSAAEIKRLIANASPSAINPFHPLSHQIHDYLHLVAALGANPEPLAPQLFVARQEIEAVKKKFGIEQMTQPIFGLNPGAEYGPAKRWPAEKFIAAAREISKRTNCCWLIFGGQNDAVIAGEIARQLSVPNLRLHDLAGKTSLRELMALLAGCRLLLTNDTGPMHVAAALGTPVVVPFGSTSPALTGPGLPGDTRHRLIKPTAPCSPCFLRECPVDFRCMNGISVERIVAAVLELVSTRED